MALHHGKCRVEQEGRAGGRAGTQTFESNLEASRLSWVVYSLSSTPTGIYVSFLAILSERNSTVDLINQDAGVLL